MARGHPPLVPFCLTVGVTGHRAAVLGPMYDPALAARLTAVMTDLRRAADDLYAACRDSFAAPPLAPRLICQLADGADQMAAGIGLDLGYDLHAVLPFPRAEYAGDFTAPGELARFEGLLARAGRVLELPCARSEDRAAYALAGRATVAHCDVLIAVWDGLAARGRGGTAEVVEHALRRGAPVIHVAVTELAPTRLIWGAHDPYVTQSRIDEFPAVDVGPGSFDALLRHVLGPPADQQECAHLAAYHAEHQRRWQPRIEYPLLMMAAGARAMRTTDVRQRRYVEPMLADNGSRGPDAGPDAQGAVPALAAWRPAFAWSDGLAAHFAQSYRSGHVFNFLFGAAAILLGLSGLLVPDVKLWLAFAELGVIGAFVLNTRIGVARNWHRRWLDYRQLAERLRPMPSLTLAGLAQPDFRAPLRGPTRWVDWYAAAIWRSIGLPSGRLTRETAALTELIVAADIRPQIAYHRASARAVAHLDHRLHQTGTLLFLVSCVSCAAFIGAFLVNHAWTVAHAADFVFLSAGLPAIGTAFFGIRVQGDFAGTAARSLVTADHLEAIANAIDRAPAGLSRTADGIEAAARAMLADLGEWRLSHQQRQLELG